MGLAGIPQVDDLALDTAGGFFAPVAGDDRAVKDHVGEALLPCSLQRLVQVRGLRGEHLDDPVPVPVGRGPGDLVVAGQRVRRGAVAEPAQPQHRLPEAGQRPAPLRSAATAPLGGQKLRDELDQFPRDVKRGTIGDHVESFSRRLSVSELDKSPASCGFPPFSADRAHSPKRGAFCRAWVSWLRREVCVAKS
jgi:hypothetical protein